MSAAMWGSLFGLGIGLLVGAIGWLVEDAADRQMDEYRSGLRDRP